VATAIAMPKLGMTMEEGTLVSWSVAIGERVEKGATLLVIESEKAEVEIEATASGFLRHAYVELGETVPCGTLLGALSEVPDEPFDADAFRAEHDHPEPVARSVAAPSPSPAAEPAAAPPRGAAPIAPAARKAARELGIDPARIPGSGPGGRVTRRDVEAWVEARKSLVDVGGGVCLDVPSEGEGDPLLLLPGFGTDVSVFARQIPPLAGRHRVLGVNPRGVGHSDAPELPSYSVTQAAADVAALVDEPAHVVGTSLGAAAAIELALEHAERVRSLTLIAPFVSASARLLAVADAWAGIAAAAAPELLARALLPWLFSTRYLEDEASRERTARGLAASLARVRPATLPRAAAGLREWSGTRTEDLGRIAVPTLVVVAAEDLLTPGAERIAQAIPGARCTLVSGAGHAVGIEDGEAVNAAILEHLGAG
jgi:pyruvate dehydrogenase E2 component (dihydrolipoamide acetyltransferase)